MQIDANMRVMDQGTDAGTAAAYFGDDRLSRITVGDAQGEDAARGAYNWWPLTLDGSTIGELRDDASGLTIHANT